MKIPAIETKRLYLRSFTPEDALFTLSIWNDPEMGEYLMDAQKETVDEAYLNEIRGLGDDPACCYLIAESKATSERIGTCSFIPGEGGAEYDIAYCVHKKFWRQGYATEMAEGMVDYARSQNAKRATILIFSENPGSNAVAKKLGFQVVDQKIRKKRGNNREFTEYKYELTL